MRVFSRFLFRFKSLYTSRYAVVTNTVTSGVMTLMEDVLCQKLENRHTDKSLDTLRSRSMLAATLILAPPGHYWYKFLDTRFPGVAPRSILKKIIADVAISPVYFGLFSTLLFYFKGMSFEQIKKEIVNKLPVIFLMDAMFWSVLQTFNFALLPPHYRIIGVKINEFVLGIILSHVLNNDYNIWTIRDKLLERFVESSDEKIE